MGIGKGFLDFSWTAEIVSIYGIVEYWKSSFQKLHLLRYSDINILSQVTNRTGRDRMTSTHSIIYQRWWRWLWWRLLIVNIISRALRRRTMDKLKNNHSSHFLLYTEIINFLRDDEYNDSCPQMKEDMMMMVSNKEIYYNSHRLRIYFLDFRTKWSEFIPIRISLFLLLLLFFHFFSLFMSCLSQSDIRAFWSIQTDKTFMRFTWLPVQTYQQSNLSTPERPSPRSGQAGSQHVLLHCVSSFRKQTSQQGPLIENHARTNIFSSSSDS